MPLRFTSYFAVAGPTSVSFAVDLDRIVAARRLSASDGSESTHSGEGDSLAPRLGAAVQRAVFWLQAGPGALASGAAGGPGPAVPRTGTAMAFRVPPGFPQPDLPPDNPLTAEGVALGRRLFFDRRLSAGGAQSCASCHAPDHACSDSVALSLGVAGKPGTRNAMPLFNLAWSPAYTWDGGKARVRDQALAAMTGPLEMNASVPVVVAALARDPGTRAGFDAAFGTGGVTAARIGLALEQYLLTIVSADSRFDRAARGEATLTAEERRGFKLFITEYDPARGRRGADCFHCHGGALFSDYAYRNNGLEARSVDPGRGAVTGLSSDAGRFKTPSLRNVALTAPYMHDGRFATLGEVVAHYDHGVRRGPNLDPNLAKHPAGGMLLGAADQKAIVAFLRTLTDESLAEKYR
jgi:cytochrome c peroxidase